MLDILKFIFSDIWHFLGTCLLLEIIFGNIGNIVVEHKKDDE